MERLNHEEMPNGIEMIDTAKINDQEIPIDKSSVTAEAAIKSLEFWAGIHQAATPAEKTKAIKGYLLSVPEVAENPVLLTKVAYATEDQIDRLWRLYDQYEGRYPVAKMIDVVREKNEVQSNVREEWSGAIDSIIVEPADPALREKMGALKPEEAAAIKKALNIEAARTNSSVDGLYKKVFESKTAEGKDEDPLLATYRIIHGSSSEDEKQAGLEKLSSIVEREL